jgi:hypothetical protein
LVGLVTIATSPRANAFFVLGLGKGAFVFENADFHSIAQSSKNITF